MAKLRRWIRQTGIAAAARDAVMHLVRPELAGFWIHVEADCLDDTIMPAVDFRLPGGLTVDELHTVLRTALDSGRAVGLELTIYNPALDEGSRGATLLANLPTKALTSDSTHARRTHRSRHRLLPASASTRSSVRKIAARG